VKRRERQDKRGGARDSDSRCSSDNMTSVQASNDVMTWTLTASYQRYVKLSLAADNNRTGAAPGHEQHAQAKPASLYCTVEDKN